MDSEGLTALKRRRAQLKSLLSLCEQTGKFPFNSMHFLSVGEIGLAAEGLFQFVEGNENFKNEVDAETLDTLRLLTTNIEGLEAYHWQS